MAQESVQPKPATPPEDPLAELSSLLMSVFEGVEPWKGEIQAGRQRNFFGALQPIEPHERGTPLPKETRYVETELPKITDGEVFLEFLTTLMAVRSARNRFTMVSLGAHFGGPLVDAALALDAINPMPCYLVGVEADPNMCAMLDEHFRENGVDPNDHWIVNSAVGDTTKPVLFTVSESRTGSNTAFGLEYQRQAVLDVINNSGQGEMVLKNIILEGTTRLVMPMDSYEGMPEANGELKFVSATTIADILNPLSFVDYLEIDIQKAEAYALEPAMEAIGRKVRWLHLGTHGNDIHEFLIELFSARGWDILINLTPWTKFETQEGSFETCDGVIFARNPSLETFIP